MQNKIGKTENFNGSSQEEAGMAVCDKVVESPTL